MTIKEVEARTGMTRANIRFYESEGLITPARGSNGYRDYSEQEVELLLRVKLLRMLEMPLEEIKGLCRGEEELLPVLDGHICRLEEQQTHKKRSQQVCRDMRRDEVRFDTLDPQPYLEQLERTEAGLEKDVMPRVQAPWRRFFARMLDWAVYALVWKLLCATGIFPKQAEGMVASIVACAVLAALVEPLLLRCFGTTLGKAIWGLRVTDPEDGRLRYSAAFGRTLQVIIIGYGLFLPVLQEVCMIAAWYRCSKGRELEWEQGSVLHLKDERVWRPAAFVAVYGVVIAAVVIATMGAGLFPAHSGALTVEEFCENYNTYADFYEWNLAYELESDGSWNRREEIFVIGGAPTPAALEFTEEDGVLTGVSFSYELVGEELLVNEGETELTLCVMSFACAQSPFGALTSAEGRELLERIDDDPYESFSVVVGNVHVECRVEYEGYYKQSGNDYCVLFPEENEDVYRYTIDFSMWVEP